MASVRKRSINFFYKRPPLPDSHYFYKLSTNREYRGNDWVTKKRNSKVIPHVKKPYEKKSSKRVRFFSVSSPCDHPYPTDNIINTIASGKVPMYFSGKRNIGLWTPTLQRMALIEEEIFDTLGIKP